MKDFNFRKYLPHLAAVALFLVLTLLYFSPLLEGKKILQHDIMQFTGMSKEIVDHREKTGEEPLWTNSMFGGMPAYQVSAKYTGNLVGALDKVFTLFLPHPANLVFLYFIGFFILLMVMRVNPWLAIAGAAGFAFSSYFFIIIEAGHNSKAHAIGYMAPVMAGIILTLNRKYLWGGLLTALFLSLEVKANHPQITYYLAMIILLYGAAVLVESVRKKEFMPFLKGAGVLAIAALFAASTNITSLWATWEYGKYTIRGKSELTSEKENRTSGLDKDYATQWSYGKEESLTLLIPNFSGGASSGAVREGSKLTSILKEKGYPEEAIEQLARPVAAHIYWGPQPFTSGPVYVGAIMAFLFILGLIIVKGPLKWWLAAATLLSLVLAWGHHLMPVTDFFLEYLPGYNKFRAVSMTLVIAEFAIPLLGILAVKELVDRPEGRPLHRIGFLTALGITAGIALLFAVAPGLLDMTVNDPADLKAQISDTYRQMLAGAIPADQLDAFATQITDLLMPALAEERQHLLQTDAFRSLVFILLGGAAIWLLLAAKVRKEYIFMVLAVLIIADMFTLNRRYLNNDSFTDKQKVEKPFQASGADQQILNDTTPGIRVLNLAVDPFNDATTSYFHHSIGGYHGAKLRRYQELIDYGIRPDIRTLRSTGSTAGTPVLNMLNTRYFIVPGENDLVALPNFNALGAAWFVNGVKQVENADQEIEAIRGFNPAETAIVDKQFANLLQGFTPSRDSADSIRLTHYEPNDLTYRYTSRNPGLAVFSEIWYPKGWSAFIDDKPAPHFRANYVLRAMVLPAGEHTVRFRFEPAVYSTGEKISLASSLLLLLLLVAAGAAHLKTLLKNRA